MSHYLLIAGSLVIILVLSYWYSLSRVDTRTENKGQGTKNAKKKKEEWALARATTQNNQLRIALISISIGLFLNVKPNIIKEIQDLIYVYSSFAVVCGLYAWSSSASYFYYTGKKDNPSKEKANIKMKTGDTSLLVSLLIAGVFTVLSALVYVKNT